LEVPEPRFEEQSVPDSGPALQDLLKVVCFGCGALNERGLKIRSRWAGDRLVCRWQPEAHHIGYPGFVYGGTVASVVDCHAIWTAMATWCREQAHDLSVGPPPLAFVTGRLSVNYLKAMRIDAMLELSAHVLEQGERKSLVACEVLQDGQICAIAEVLAVRVKAAS
jgi:acyl-coenzyme A thioesterase PaaI-like protein